MAITGLNIGTLFIDLKADASQYNKALDQVETRTLESAQKILSGTKALVVGVTAAAAGAFGLVKIASDAEEINSKFNTVFNQVSDDAKRIAKDLDDNYGLAADASQNLLANTADLLSGFGFTQRAALDLSKDVQKLAVDLGSFQNVDAKRASEALTKALLGERESVKLLGIAINKTDVENRIALETAKGMIFETERQATAFATLKLAQEQSKNAIGDYARTQDSFANQFKEFKADIRDVAVGLGTALLPTAKELLAEFRNGTTDLKGFISEAKELAILARDGFNIAKAVVQVTLLTKGIQLTVLAGTSFVSMLAAARANLTAVTPASGSLVKSIGKINLGMNAAIALGATLIITVKTLTDEFNRLREATNQSENFQLGLSNFDEVIKNTAGDAKRAVEFLGELGRTDLGSFDESIAEGVQSIRNQVKGIRDIVPLAGEDLKRFNASVERYIEKQIKAAKATDAYKLAVKDSAAATKEIQKNLEALSDSNPVNRLAKDLLEAKRIKAIREELKLTSNEFSQVGKAIKEMVKAGDSTKEIIDNIKELTKQGIFARDSTKEIADLPKVQFIKRRPLEIEETVKVAPVFQGNTQAFAPGVDKGSQQDAAISARGRLRSQDITKKTLKEQEAIRRASEETANNTDDINLKLQGAEAL